MDRATEQENSERTGPAVATGKLPQRHGRKRFAIYPTADGWTTGTWVSGHGVRIERVDTDSPLMNQWRTWTTDRDKAATEVSDLYDSLRDRTCPACGDRMGDAAEWVHKKLAPQGKIIPPGTVRYCSDCDLNIFGMRSGSHGKKRVVLAHGSKATIVDEVEFDDPVNYYSTDEGRVTDHGEYYSVLKGTDGDYYRTVADRLRSLKTQATSL